MSTPVIPPHHYADYAGHCLVCGESKDWPLHDPSEFGMRFLTDVTPDPAADPNLLEHADDADDEEATADDDIEPGQTGVMIALFPDFDTAQKLRAKGGEKSKNLHVTLAYLGEAADLNNPDDLIATVKQFAEEEGHALTGEVSGVGVFTAGAGAVTYASIDLPGLPALRQALVQVLDAAGFKVSMLHGYTPHMTLAMGDRRDLTPENVKLTFETMTVAIAGKRHTFTLGAAQSAADKTKHKYQHPALVNPGTKMIDDTDDPTGHIVGSTAYPPCATCGEAKDSDVHTKTAESVAPGDGPLSQPDGMSEMAAVPVERAFVSELNGRTQITAPAHLGSTWEKALTPNPHMMWMQGRFVGADEANRNKAFWSTEDLELGDPTVAHGPLNWLHEAKHVIGTIADSRLVKPSQEQAAEGVNTHIQAVAGVWKWIYPDEAWVIENANDQGKLWYSMECVSNSVQCMGEGGCGEQASYGDYLAGKCCDHLREKSSVRRFVDPIFLGGAVIVPPVRPGWADANANVIRQAASMAERSFDLLSPANMSTSEWELMMAMVTKFAESR